MRSKGGEEGSVECERSLDGDKLGCVLIPSLSSKLMRRLALQPSN